MHFKWKSGDPRLDFPKGSFRIKILSSLYSLSLVRLRIPWVPSSSLHPSPSRIWEYKRTDLSLDCPP